MSYVSKQFMGPNITAFINSIIAYFEEVYVAILYYLSLLSISSANEKHTEMIGRLIGFPRPLVQGEIHDLTSFRFTLSYYQDVDIGFSTTYGELGEGGLLSPTTEDEGLIYLDLVTYKEMLKIVARAQSEAGRYSLQLIDEICAYVAGNNNYVISYFGTANDILITFYDVSLYGIYIVGYVLNYLFDSIPSITVTKELT